MPEPLVTVVISPREGHFMAETSLMSVLADDCIPFDLIYIDFGASPEIESALRAQAAARNFKYVHRDAWVAPSAARKSVLAEVATKYVAFTDNDVIIERGCLEKLVACAEETDAGLVCPLYLQAGGGREPSIHMAGGYLKWAKPPEHGLVREGHRFADGPPDMATAFKREKVDYTEYHYVLGRMDLLGRPDAVSDDVLLVHEHIDLALFAREQGMDVVFEPSAQVTYVAFEPRLLADVAFYRRRWNVEACAASLAAFERRWPIADRDVVIGAMRPYAADRLREVEIREAWSNGIDLGQPMRRDELAQSRFDLREQALQRGYSTGDAQSFEQACDLATLMFDGLYRPDGRPFLSHVIGTASVLVRYELQASVVRAGLLHAALTHRPEWMAEEEVTGALRAAGIEPMVRGQPFAREFLASETDLGLLNMNGVRVAAMLAANEVDMRLSGEYRATGRPGDLTPVALTRTAGALSQFGVDGLAASAAGPPSPIDARPLFGGAHQTSFRLDARNRRVLPV